MAKKTPQSTTPPRERVFLVGVEVFGDDHLLTLEDSLTELALLSDTDGLEALERITDRSPRTKVVMFTGHENPTYIARAVALGLQHVVDEKLTHHHIPVMRQQLFVQVFPEVAPGLRQEQRVIGPSLGTARVGCRRNNVVVAGEQHRLFQFKSFT